MKAKMKNIKFKQHFKSKNSFVQVKKIMNLTWNYSVRSFNRIWSLKRVKSDSKKKESQLNIKLYLYIV